MFQKWFPPGTGDSLFACDSGNEFTFFAPSDLAWDNSWLTANTQTLDRTKLIDYYSIPETLTYHLFFGITDRNNLIPPTNTPVKQFMVSGSPIYLFRDTDAAGTTFPSIGVFYNEIFPLVCNTEMETKFCNTILTKLTSC